MIRFQIFQTIGFGKLLTQKYVSQNLMLLEHDKIDITHSLLASNWVALIFRGNVQIQQRSRDQSIGFSISHFFFALLLSFKLLALNFVLNHFSQQSATNLKLVVNISEIAILLFLA